MRRSAGRVGALALCAVVVLAACTSNGSGKGSVSLPPTGPPPLSLSPTDTIAVPAQTTSSSASTPASSTAASSAPKPAGTSCPFSSLRLTALRGSGYQGHEFAQIVFTNKGTGTCTMYGYPGVSLRAGNALLGQPAARDTSTPPGTVTLRPGDSATADITDFSTCNAARSDTVRVYPPDSTQYVDLPLNLRGCTLSVRPVVHE